MLDPANLRKEAGKWDRAQTSNPLYFDVFFLSGPQGAFCHLQSPELIPMLCEGFGFGAVEETTAPHGRLCPPDTQSPTGQINGTDKTGRLSDVTVSDRNR